MKSWFFKKINDIDKPLTRLTKNKRERYKLLSGMNQDISTGPSDTKRIREYYEQLYEHKFDNLAKMDQVFKKHKLPNSPNMK